MKFSRVLSVVLVLCLCLTVVPFAAFATNQATLNVALTDENGNAVTGVQSGTPVWLQFSLANYSGLVGNVNDGSYTNVIGAVNAGVKLDTVFTVEDNAATADVDDDVVAVSPYASTSVSAMKTNNGYAFVMDVNESDADAWLSKCITAADLDANNGVLFRVKLNVTGDFSLKTITLEDEYALNTKTSVGVVSTGDANNSKSINLSLGKAYTIPGDAAPTYFKEIPVVSKTSIKSADWTVTGRSGAASQLSNAYIDDTEQSFCTGSTATWGANYASYIQHNTAAVSGDNFKIEFAGELNHKGVVWPTLYFQSSTVCTKSSKLDVGDFSFYMLAGLYPTFTYQGNIIATSASMDDIGDPDGDGKSDFYANSSTIAKIIGGNAYKVEQQDIKSSSSIDTDKISIASGALGSDYTNAFAAKWNTKSHQGENPVYTITYKDGVVTAHFKSSLYDADILSCNLNATFDNAAIRIGQETPGNAMSFIYDFSYSSYYELVSVNNALAPYANCTDFSEIPQAMKDYQICYDNATDEERAEYLQGNYEIYRNFMTEYFARKDAGDAQGEAGEGIDKINSDTFGSKTSATYFAFKGLNSLIKDTIPNYNNTATVTTNASDWYSAIYGNANNGAGEILIGKSGSATSFVSKNAYDFSNGFTLGATVALTATIGSGGLIDDAPHMTYGFTVGNVAVLLESADVTTNQWTGRFAGMKVAAATSTDAFAADGNTTILGTTGTLNFSATSPNTVAENVAKYNDDATALTAEGTSVSKIDASTKYFYAMNVIASYKNGTLTVTATTDDVDMSDPSAIDVNSLTDKVIYTKAIDASALGLNSAKTGIMAIRNTPWGNVGTIYNYSVTPNASTVNLYTLNNQMATLADVTDYANLNTIASTVAACLNNAETKAKIEALSNYPVYTEYMRRYNGYKLGTVDGKTMADVLSVETLSNTDRVAAKAAYNALPEAFKNIVIANVKELLDPVFNYSANIEADITCSVSDFYVGQKIQLTAPTVDGYKFVGWTNGVNQIVATANSIIFELTNGDNYIARYEATADSADYFTVIGKNYTSKLKIYSDAEGKTLLSSGSTVSLASAFGGFFDRYGYTVTGYSVKIGDANEVTVATDATITVTANTIVTPIYEAAAQGDFSISVNGTVVKTNMSYNAVVTLNADEYIGNGTYFSSWICNGSVVSYDSNYKFYVTGNTNLTIATTQNPFADIKAVPTVTSLDTLCQITDANGKARASFFFERSIADSTKYEYISAGVVYTKNDAYKNKLTLSNVDSSNVKKGSAKGGANGTYNPQIAFSEGVTVYAVGYLTYADKTTGEVYTIYSSVAQLTYTA